MPWCPKCKNEYLEGIAVCADCKVELVDSLEDAEKKPIFFGEKEQMQTLFDFLEKSGLKTVKMEEDVESNMYELFVEKEETETAKRWTRVFLQEEALHNNDGEESEKEEPAKAIPHYEKKTDRAEEFKSSAIALLAVGILGMTAVVLNWFEIFPIVMNMTTKYLVTGVMGAIFILFTVIGFFSIRSFKVLKREGEEENNLEKEILIWCRKNITKQAVDDDLPEEETVEEIKYFKRNEKIKKMISETYMNLEEGFLDKLADDLYAELFE